MAGQIKSMASVFILLLSFFCVENSFAGGAVVKRQQAQKQMMKQRQAMIQKQAIAQREMMMRQQAQAQAQAQVKAVIQQKTQAQMQQAVAARTQMEMQQAAQMQSQAMQMEIQNHLQGQVQGEIHGQIEGQIQNEIGGAVLNGIAPEINAHLNVQEDIDPSQVADTVAIEDLWKTFETTSVNWPLIMETKAKVLTVSRWIDRFKQKGTTITKDPMYYAQMIDSMSSANPEFLKRSFDQVLQFVAIVEYDFDNGTDKDAMARKILGEKAFEANRQRIFQARQAMSQKSNPRPDAQIVH